MDIGKYKYDLQQKTLEWSGGMVKDPMSNMHKLPASVVKEYAKQDVALTLKLWNLFNKELDKVLHTKEDGEQKTCRKIFELETKLFPCLVDMKFKGVKIDVQKAIHFGKRLEKRRDNLINIIKKRTTVDLQIWAAASIKKLLNQQKITDYKKTPKSGMPQLPKDFLTKHSNRFLRMIAKARECDKAKNTFGDGLLGFVHKGRIHADINQIRSDQGGTVTGRFSMSNNDSSADFHQTVADMAKIPRSQAKTINLGLFYGMGKMKLQKELGLDKEKAKELFADYHKKVPFVKLLSQDLIEFAQENKLLFTLHDRFCRFDRYEETNRKWNPKLGKFDEVPLLTRKEALKEFERKFRKADKKCQGRDLTKKEWEYFTNYYVPAFTYKALNKLIQGSAADMTKKSMVALYENGIIPHIQIHDEVDISVESPENAEKIIEIMESAVELKVPNKVDYEQGDNWGDIK